MHPLVIALLAQTTAPAGAPAPWWAKIVQSITVNPILLLFIPIGLMLFLSARNKRNQEKAQHEKLGGIKRGDRVQTIGGILGKVVDSDENRVLLKVDESSNTKIWFTRSAIHRVLEEEKGDAKAVK